MIRETPSDDLQRLVERIEGASEGSALLDHAIGYALFPERESWPLYTTSLDAALTLVPEGVNIGLHIDHNGNDCAWSSRAVGWQPQVTAGCVTPALALCAAALRARINQDSDNGRA